MNMDPVVDFTDRIAQQNYKNHRLTNSPQISSLLQSINTNVTNSKYPLASMIWEPLSQNEGLILAYLAQLFREDCSWQIEDLGDFVIATAFIIVDDQIRLIVGINAHINFHQYIPDCCEIIKSYEDYLKIPIIIATGAGENDPHIESYSKAQGRFDNYLQYTMIDHYTSEAINLCWHSEQKIIKYVRQNYPMARKTLTVLGIAHIKGPCTEETAGTGTNRCLDYLQVKTGKTSKNSEYIRTVNAYWFSRTPRPGDSELHFIKPEEYSDEEEGRGFEDTRTSLSPRRGRSPVRSPSPMIRERSFSPYGRFNNYDEYRVEKMEERDEYDRGRFSRSPSFSPERERSLSPIGRRPIRERSFTPSDRFPTYDAYLKDFYSHK